MGSLTLAALLGVSITSNGPARQTTYVEVNGARYRVTTKGDEVEVTKKAFLVKYTIAERDHLREAVFKATGCHITDELAPSAKLRGKLVCADRN